MGCRSGRVSTTSAPHSVAIVWPEPPAKPRVSFSKHITTPRDLGVRRSVWQMLLTVFAGPDIASRGFVRPSAVAFDAEGNICVADPGEPAVCYLDRKSRRLRRWTRVGKTDFVEPVGISKARDAIFVADSGLGAVMAFNTSGKPLWTASRNLNRPTGLALLPNALAVADAGAHRVVVLDLQGRTISQFGRRGTGPGEFNFPTHVAVDCASTGSVPRIYITDAMNHRVQAFDPTGRFLDSIGGIGDSSGHLSKPKGIAVDAQGHVYVVDALFDNIQIFDRDGHFLMHWGAAGSGAGEFWLPVGIAINRNEILVADSYNKRLQSFRRLSGEAQVTQ